MWQTVCWERGDVLPLKLFLLHRLLCRPWSHTASLVPPALQDLMAVRTQSNTVSLPITGGTKPDNQAEEEED